VESQEGNWQKGCSTLTRSIVGPALRIQLDLTHAQAVEKVVAALEDEGFGVLSDPISMLDVVQNPDLEPVAREARARLERVVKTLGR
jgi:biotin operon repressor